MGTCAFYLAGVPWAWEDLWHRCGDTLKHWQGEGNPPGTSFWFLVNVYHQEVSANNKISTQNCLRCNYVHVFNVHCLLIFVLQIFQKWGQFVNFVFMEYLMCLEKLHIAIIYWISAGFDFLYLTL